MKKRTKTCYFWQVQWYLCFTMCFNHLYSMFCSYFSFYFELNMPCFLLKSEKIRKYQNLLFLAVSVQVGLYKRKLRTKKEKLGNDVMKFYLRNHEKTRKPWLILLKTRKRRQDENLWLSEIFQKIGSPTYQKD